MYARPRLLSSFWVIYKQIQTRAYLYTNIAPYSKAHCGKQSVKNVPNSFASLYAKNIEDNRDKGEEAISNAVMASFYHNYDGPFASNKNRDEVYHKLCAKNDWCKGNTEREYKYGLLTEVRIKDRDGIKDIFTVLSAKELTTRCKLNLSQNINESLHQKL